MDMVIEFPITPDGALTLFGAATFAAIAGMWLKNYLADWRWTNLLILLIGELVTCGAQLINTLGQPTAAQMFTAVAVGFFGASVATFGWETVSNILGLIGVGKRSDVALDRQALERAQAYMAKAGQR